MGFRPGGGRWGGVRSVDRLRAGFPGRERGLLLQEKGPSPLMPRQPRAKEKGLCK